MAKVTIPFDQSVLSFEASDVYVLAAAQDILRRMRTEIVDPTRYPPEFIAELESSLTLLEFLVRQTISQLRKR